MDEILAQEIRERLEESGADPDSVDEILAALDDQ